MRRHLPKLAVILTGATTSALACDLCQISVPALGDEPHEGGVFVGMSEQFTHFGTLQEEGDEIPNGFDQKLDSSITQILAGYQYNERFGLQFNLPVIYRSYRRAEESGVEEDTVSGLGDVSLLGRFLVWDHTDERTSAHWHVYGGLKFPTGDSDRLREESEEDHGDPGAMEHEEISGIHGHDLALGSGSWDGVVGTEIYARYQRWFLTAGLQYAIRSEGDFDYQFANDLTWNGGPGFYVLENETWMLGLQAVVSGETKGRDEFDGEKLDDTDITSVFVGPQLILRWKSHLSATLAGDLPISIDNGGLQAVPDYRIRASLSWHF